MWLGWGREMGRVEASRSPVLCYLHHGQASLRMGAQSGGSWAGELQELTAAGRQ